MAKGKGYTNRGKRPSKKLPLHKELATGKKRRPGRSKRRKKSRHI